MTWAPQPCKRYPASHAAAARALFRPIASIYGIESLAISGVANNPSQAPRVFVDVTLDVSEQALVGPNQYCKSMADRPTEDFIHALLDHGFQTSPARACPLRPARALATVHVRAVVQHLNEMPTVHKRTLPFCFDPQ